MVLVWRHSFLKVGIILALAATGSCRTTDEGETESSLMAAGINADLAKYEAYRIAGLNPKREFKNFVTAQGFRDIIRDGQGNATGATLRVLSDNTNNEIYVLGDFNQWKKNPGSKLKPVAGAEQFFEIVVTGLKHGQEYRLLVNDKQLIDPAAASYSPVGKPNFNSVFWDFERPGAYRLKNAVADLRTKPVMVGESEVFELSRSWRHRGNGQTGPRVKGQTYKFIAESGLINELKNAGYNAIEFVPFNASVDGDSWKYRYQVFGLFAADSRYGSPDDFARMCDEFNKLGIAVIMDAVIGHYPFKCEDGNQCNIKIGDIGLHHWKKSDGRRLYGENSSPWGTYRYDYSNPYVRRFLADSILHMMNRYGIAGVRFDNYDGIRFENGGTEFLKQLAAEIRDYRPEAMLIAEMFFGEAKVLHGVFCETENNDPAKPCRLDKNGNAVVGGQSGYGINMRTHSNFFDFIKDNMLKNTNDINMDALVHAIRDPWGWQEAARIQYITNHDEAANRRDGATGQYPASLILGEGNDGFRNQPDAGANWKYVQLKTKAFASLAILSSTAYLDMPQLRIQQRGTFYTNPAVDWGQTSASQEQARVYDYFRDLSNLYINTSAFAFHNLHGNIENHYDPVNKIISLYRRDQSKDEHWYAIVNLSHEAVHKAPYEIGVHKAGGYKVEIDSDDRRYVGDSARHFATGALEDKLAASNMIVKADCSSGMHGKPCKIALPYLGEYASVVLRWQH